MLIANKVFVFLLNFYFYVWKHYWKYGTSFSGISETQWATEHITCVFNGWSTDMTLGSTTENIHLKPGHKNTCIIAKYISITYVFAVYYYFHHYYLLYHYLIAIYISVGEVSVQIMSLFLIGLFLLFINIFV